MSQGSDSVSDVCFTLLAISAPRLGSVLLSLADGTGVAWRASGHCPQLQGTPASPHPGLPLAECCHPWSVIGPAPRCLHHVLTGPLQAVAPPSCPRWCRIYTVHSLYMCTLQLTYILQNITLILYEVSTSRRTSCLHEIPLAGSRVTV